jgi:hypothetical protein
MRKTGNRLRKTIAFWNNKGPVKRIYLAAGAAAQLEVLLLNGTTEERGFSPHIASKTLQSMYFIVAIWPGQFFFTPRNGVVGRPLSQEAVDGGSVAAQAAHNCCRRFSFLLLGHEPHFLRHWNFYKASSSIFTKHLVKNYSKKKKGGPSRPPRAAHLDRLAKKRT